MGWTKPEVVDVNMSAEIGAYQDDTERSDESAALWAKAPDGERIHDAVVDAAIACP